MAQRLPVILVFVVGKVMCSSSTGALLRYGAALFTEAGWGCQVFTGEGHASRRYLGGSGLGVGVLRQSVCQSVLAMFPVSHPFLQNCS